MSANVAPDAVHPLASSSRPAVWERVWRNHPSDVKDDAALERERKSVRWQAILRRLDAVFGSVAGLKTVELGSGRGDLSALLAERGADVTLLDASEKALEQARHRFARLGLPASYCQADMLRLNESTLGQFDVALSSGVIEHFKDNERIQVIQAHRDSIRPGGMVIISAPNAWCLPYRLWKFYLELRGWWPYGMEIPYTEGELIRRARQANLGRLDIVATGLWQSLSAHWGRSLLKWNVDWSHRRSWLDFLQGVNLLLFGIREDVENGSGKA